MTSVNLPAVVIRVFTVNSASMRRTSATLSPARTEALALTVWAPTAAPVQWHTVDRTAR